MTKPSDSPGERHSTNSTLWLLGGLGLITVVFIIAQLAGIEPLIKLFRWLAIVL